MTHLWIGSSAHTTATVLKLSEFANLVDQHMRLIVLALRAYKDGRSEPNRKEVGVMSTQAVGAAGASTGTGVPNWVEVDLIEGFETKWPAAGVLRAQGHTQLHEHYGPMKVYEGHDQVGLVRLAVGEPEERYEFYGRQRGWLSVWEVINDRPARQLANFIEVDDFTKTHDRAALISGKDGGAKKGFSPPSVNCFPGCTRACGSRCSEIALSAPTHETGLLSSRGTTKRPSSSTTPSLIFG